MKKDKEMLKKKTGRIPGIVMLLLVLACACLLGGCGGTSQDGSADLTAVMQQIEQENLVSADMTDITMDVLASTYGISSADIVQFAGKMPANSLSAEEIIMIEAAPDKAAVVEEKVQAHYQSKANTANNYSPEEYALIKSCEVTVTGNYVVMIVSENAQAISDIFEAAL